MMRSSCFSSLKIPLMSRSNYFIFHFNNFEILDISYKKSVIPSSHNMAYLFTHLFFDRLISFLENISKCPPLILCMGEWGMLDPLKRLEEKKMGFNTLICGG
jgi:hypothetical protein